MKRITTLIAIFIVILLAILFQSITLSQEKTPTIVQAHSAKTHLPIHKPGDLFKKNFQINIWKTFNLKTEGHDG